MPASKSRNRVRFKVEVVEDIARDRGLATLKAKADYFGSTESNFSRVYNGVTAPGEDFIANTLAARTELIFDNLFEVVEVSE